MWAFLSDGYCFFFFNDTAPTEIYTLSLHDALPISPPGNVVPDRVSGAPEPFASRPLLVRSEEHTSELQSPKDLVCRLLLEKKKKRETKSQHEVPSPPLQPAALRKWADSCRPSRVRAAGRNRFKVVVFFF